MHNDHAVRNMRDYTLKIQIDISNIRLQDIALPGRWRAVQTDIVNILIRKYPKTKIPPTAHPGIRKLMQAKTRDANYQLIGLIGRRAEILQLNTSTRYRRKWALLATKHLTAPHQQRKRYRETFRARRRVIQIYANIRCLGEKRSAQLKTLGAKLSRQIGRITALREIGYNPIHTERI